MKLRKAAGKFPELTFTTDNDPEVFQVSENSSLIPEKPWIFIARKGFRSNGWNYAQEAVKNGAVTILSDIFVENDLSVPVMICPDLKSFLPEFLPWFYDYPENKLKMTAITGTNGKTTIAHLLECLLPASCRMGTTNISVLGEIYKTVNTTPDITTIYYFLHLAAESRAENFIMETTSHAISQGRLGNIEFDLLIFTNLGRDHLDFHPTMEDYRETKFSLLEKSGKNRCKKPCVILNIDDETGALFLSRLRNHISCRSCSINDPNADYHAVINSSGVSGSDFSAGNQGYFFPIPGNYNVSNALQAIAAATELGMSPVQISSRMKEFSGVPGRMQKVDIERYNILVDFAHTPEGLENILKAAKDVTRGKIILVFGCGGNRDRGKRPVMARIAEKSSDFVIVTDDNPRFEDPSAITNEITEGFSEGFRSFIVKQPREEAIRFAMSLLGNDDLLLIAGKGHEDYQEIRGVRHPYSDFDAVKKFTQGSL